MLHLSLGEILFKQVSLESESEEGVKKLMSVLATSTLVTGIKEKAIETAKSVETVEAIETAEVGKDSEESKDEYSNLARVLCIRYSITIRKKSVLALLDSGIEINTIHSSLARELELPIRPTNVEAQKIDGTMLDTFGIVVTAVSVTDKANRVKFFEKTFLVANVSPKIVFEISFLTLSIADIDFLGRKLRWKTYTTKETLPTTRRVELVGKKEFPAVALDPEYETYIVYVGSVSFDVLSSSSPLKLNVYPFRRPQVSGLIAKKAPTKVPAEYSDFADVFSPDSSSELPEQSGINDHVIELVDSYHQPPYRPIYSLGPVELETLKAYIETNLANGFIKLSKSPAGAPILLNWKSDGSF